MKIRSGFVSNSSSTSFVVIGSGPRKSIPLDLIDGERTLWLGRRGRMNFGWVPEILTDIESRLNLAWVASEDEPELRRKFLDTLCECDYRILNVEMTPMKWPGHIDRQSADSITGDVFASLEAFLFNDGSEIHLDNDNDQ